MLLFFEIFKYNYLYCFYIIIIISKGFYFALVFFIILINILIVYTFSYIIYHKIFVIKFSVIKNIFEKKF